MVLRAAGALARSCRFEFGDDLIDGGGVALDRMRNGTAA